MSKRTYTGKRRFEETTEPAADIAHNVDPGAAAPGESFVIQQHYATRLHHDLRLEMLDGGEPVLVSWAVPKGVPFKKGEVHLAVHVEDHPMDYATFEGTIPKGNYGAGEVRIFDAGTYEVLEQGPGKLTIRLQGDRAKGVWHLNRARGTSDKDEWIVLLGRDERGQRDALPAMAPMMATLARAAFDDDSWIFEPKWDGVRTLAVCTSDDTRLFSRNQRDVTATYPELVKLHDRLVAVEAIVDGEIVAFEHGRPSFERLQSRINLQNARDIERAVSGCPVAFIAFDLLYLDGRCVTSEPLERRKELLQQVLVVSDKVHLSPHVQGDGKALAAAAVERRLEGIVAKKLGGSYRPGKRVKDWLKIKIVHDGDVVIGGWSRGEGSRSATFGALLVGAYEDGRLRYMGSVGTGFDDDTIARLLDLLRGSETEQCPFDADPRELRTAFGKAVKQPRWVRPELVARVEYRELTSQRRLRAPSFKGLRNDKDPRQCLLADFAPAQDR